MFLDQVKQLFFRFEVVVQAGERNAAGAGKIAHRCGRIALFVKNIGGVHQYLGQAAIETGLQARPRGWNTSSPGRKLANEWEKEPP